MSTSRSTSATAVIVVFRPASRGQRHIRRRAARPTGARSGRWSPVSHAPPMPAAQADRFPPRLIRCRGVAQPMRTHPHRTGEFPVATEQAARPGLADRRASGRAAQHHKTLRCRQRQWALPPQIGRHLCEECRHRLCWAVWSTASKPRSSAPTSWSRSAETPSASRSPTPCSGTASTGRCSTGTSLSSADLRQPPLPRILFRITAIPLADRAVPVVDLSRRVGRLNRRERLGGTVGLVSREGEVGQDRRS